MNRLLSLVIAIFPLALWAQFAAPVGPQSNTLNTANQIRGYHFVAPTSFTICGVYIPDDNSSLPQNVEIVRFTNGAPPAWIMTTNDFVSLFYSAQYVPNDTIPCQVPVAKGDIIGVYGARGNSTLMYNSLSTANYVSSIYGKPVTFVRSGMNNSLHNQQMQDIFREQSQEIGRIAMRYHCCEPPKPDVIYGPAEVCPNIAYKFYVDSSFSATQYNWQVPVGAVINSGQGTDTITVTFQNAITDTIWVSTQNGCGNSLTEYKVVSSNPIIPTISYVWPNLVSSTAPSYQWYLNSNPLPGETMQEHTPLQNGNYEVEIDTLGCKYKSSVFNFDSFSIQEFIAAQVQIYPVPVGNLLHIQLPAQLLQENVRVEIYSLSGNMVASSTITSAPETIDVSALSGGMYVLKVYTSDAVISKKLLKQ